MKKERNNLKEIFKDKWYSDEDIKNHYKAVKYINSKNKEKIDKLKIEYKEEFEKAKKYFKKVSFSLKWDWFWLNNKYWRLFVHFNELDFYINYERK
jgi:hypothetical protein